MEGKASSISDLLKLKEEICKEKKDTTEGAASAGEAEPVVVEETGEPAAQTAAATATSERDKQVIQSGEDVPIIEEAAPNIEETGEEAEKLIKVETDTINYIVDQINIKINEVLEQFPDENRQEIKDNIKNYDQLKEKIMEISKFSEINTKKSEIDNRIEVLKEDSKIKPLYEERKAKITIQTEQGSSLTEQNREELKTRLAELQELINKYEEENIKPLKAEKKKLIENLEAINNYINLLTIYNNDLNYIQNPLFKELLKDRILLIPYELIKTKINIEVVNELSKGDYKYYVCVLFENKEDFCGLKDKENILPIICGNGNEEFDNVLGKLFENIEDKNKVQIIHDDDSILEKFNNLGYYNINTNMLGFTNEHIRGQYVHNIFELTKPSASLQTPEQSGGGKLRKKQKQLPKPKKVTIKRNNLSNKKKLSKKKLM